MTNQERKELEQKLLYTALEPEEDKQENLGLVSNLSTKIVRFAKEHPKAFFRYITFCIIALFMFGFVGFGLFSLKANAQGGFFASATTDKQEIKPKEEKEPTQSQDILEGFSDLSKQYTITDTATAEEQTDGSDAVSVPDTDTGFVMGETLDIADTKKETAAGTYYTSPIVSSAGVSDIVFQIGEHVYTLPSRVSEFEENGMKLITLGSLTPDENAMLDPKQRDGYLQYQNERYYVRLSNGDLCNYHDLKVIAIVADTTSQSFVCGGETKIGTEEAEIASDFSSISYNELTKQTFYSFGSLEGEALFNNLTGKKVELTTKGGKVVKIYLFNDGTVS